MNKNKAVIAGRLGADARIHAGSNGAWSIRINVATHKTKGGEEVTTWHSVCYWSESEREVEYLRTQLVRGAKVYVEGALSSYKRPHSEYPVEMTIMGIDATEIQLLSTPIAEADHAESDTHAPPAAESVTRAQPQHVAPAQRERPTAFSEAPARPAPPSPRSTPRPTAAHMPAQGVPLMTF